MLRATRAVLAAQQQNQPAQHLEAAAVVHNRLTRLFRCQYPVVLPGMSWISTPHLVAVVCNAGGVGILATGPLSAEETRRSIHEIRALTDRPFGVGATLLMPGAAENAKVAIEEQVPIINVSLGKADWIAQGVHSYGGTLLATVTNVKHAKAALDGGADALMATGHEAAAHGGNLTSSVLVGALSREFPDVPIVAAGGFADGRGLASALCMGADGVAMGSRLAVTLESPLADQAKQAIVNATESDTLYGKNFDGIHARVLKTPAAQKLMDRRPSLPTILYRALRAARQMNVPLWKVLPGLVTQFDQMFMVAQFGAATEALMAATVRGNMETGVQFVGQSAGMIRSVESVEDVVQRTVREAREVARRQASLLCADDNTNTGATRGLGGEESSGRSAA
jgi:enoyl-[acyl-carrier protein] reductase II